MILTGTLLTPTGLPYKNAYVRLVAKATSEQVLKGVTSGFTTDEDGVYSIDCPHGSYSVVLLVSTGAQTIGAMYLDEDTTSTSINELILIGDAAASNPIAKQVAADAALAEASKDAAAVSATQAATSEQAVEDSLQAVQVIQTDVTTKASEVTNNTAIVQDATIVAQQAEASATESAELASSVLGTVNIYPDTTAGLAATAATPNKYFSIVSPEDIESLILYKNVTGVPVEQKRYPSDTAIAGIIPSLGVTATGLYPWINSVVDLITDEDGDVRVLLSQIPNEDPVFYGSVANVDSSAYPPISTATLLEAGILSVSEFTSNLYPDYVEVMYDVDGAVRILQVVGAGKDMTNYSAVSSGGSTPEYVVPTGYYIWVVTNQSNQDGRGDYLQSPSIPAGMGYMWKGGVLLPLADPVNTTTSTGSAWPSFAKRFYELTGFGSIFVPAAVGGTPQTAAAALTAIGTNSHWDVGGTLRTTALSRTQAAITALDSAGVMWQMGGIVGGGGERDAQNIDNPSGSTGSITAATYKTAAQGMLSYFRTNLNSAKIPFIMSRVARDATGDTTGFQQIRAAQMELCANIEGFYMGWTAGLAAINAGRVKPDGFDLHFLQSDLNDMGASMATVAANTCLGRA